MKLADWLDTEKVTQDDFAARIGTSQAAVARYAKGIRIPRPKQMGAIAEATAGKVTSADFYAPAPTGGSAPGRCPSLCAAAAPLPTTRP